MTTAEIFESQTQTTVLELQKPLKLKQVLNSHSDKNSEIREITQFENNNYNLRICF